MLKRLLPLLLLVYWCSCQQNPAYDYESMPKEERDSIAHAFFDTATKYGQGRAGEHYYLTKALEADPELAAAWRAKSIAYNKRGLHHEGYTMLNKAVALDPETWSGTLGYMRLYFLRDYEGAIEAFKTYDAFTPNFMDAPKGENIHFLIGLAYKQLKEYATAEAEFDKYIDEITKTAGEDWVDVYTFMYRGLVRKAQGNTEGALEDFNRVIKYNAKGADGYYHKAVLLKELGQMEEAKMFAKEGFGMFLKSYKYQRPYVEVFDELYLADFEELLASF